MQHPKSFLQLESFCNENNCEGGLAFVQFPDVETRPDVWEVHLSYPNLLHLLQIKKFSGKQRDYRHYFSDSDSNTHIELDSLVQDTVNLSGCDSDDIKSLMLTTYCAISTEIIFLLLCSKRADKWTSLNVESLLNDILCTPESIYKELTAYEIDRILRVLQTYSSKQCPLVVRPKMKKLTKANFLAHVLGHYKRYIPSRKKPNELRTLAALSRDEVVRSVPEDVIRVG